MNLEIIPYSGIKRRLKHEFDILKNNGLIADVSNILIEEEKDNYCNKSTYKISILNILDNNNYQFSIQSEYPFRPPRLKINSILYSQYQKVGSIHFANALTKYKKMQCFCCESILCSNNWGPQFTMKDIFEEVKQFRDICKEIAHRVIIDVVKRKYLIDDINILEWLY